MDAKDPTLKSNAEAARRAEDKVKWVSAKRYQPNNIGTALRFVLRNVTRETGLP
jgi:hypothetical protein